MQVLESSANHTSGSNTTPPPRYVFYSYTISLQVGTLGITKFASSALGDIIHVEMPAVGTTYKKGETAVSESS